MNMFKVVRMSTRRRDLSHAQFKDYWLKNHARLEARVIAESPVQKIVATFAVPDRGRAPAFDGMNLVQRDAPAMRFVAGEIATS